MRRRRERKKEGGHVPKAAMEIRINAAEGEGFSFAPPWPIPNMALATTNFWGTAGQYQKYKRRKPPEKKNPIA